MPHLELEIDEQRAIEEIVSSRSMISAMKKFFQFHHDLCTSQSRNHLNAVPASLHEECRERFLAPQYAAMAKAYGAMWAELEKAVDK